MSPSDFEQLQPDENPYAPPQIQPSSRPPLPGTWAPQVASQNRSPRQWQAVIRQQVRGSEPLRHIRDRAILEGLAPDIADAQIREEQAAYRKSGLMVIAVGGGMSLLGSGATLVSYLDAAPQGGQFVIWWGPVVFGLIVLAIGLARFARANRN